MMAVAYPHTTEPRETNMATHVLNMLFECVTVDMMKDQEHKTTGCRELFPPQIVGKGGGEGICSSSET